MYVWISMENEDFSGVQNIILDIFTNEDGDENKSKLNKQERFVSNDDIIDFLGSPWSL